MITWWLLLVPRLTLCKLTLFSVFLSLCLFLSFRSFVLFVIFSSHLFTTFFRGVKGVEQNCFFLKELPGIILLISVNASFLTNYNKQDSKRIRKRIIDCLETANFPTQTDEVSLSFSFLFSFTHFSFLIPFPFLHFFFSSLRVNNCFVGKKKTVAFRCCRRGSHWCRILWWTSW